jgi:hypothetical protein
MRGVVSILFWMAIVVVSPFHTKGQSNDTTNACDWYSGVRFQVTGGATIEKTRYRQYKTGNPNTSGSFTNDLAGFNRRGINPMVVGQLDYDVLRKSKKLSLYTGLGWTFSSIDYSGIRDSLIVYELDSTILKKQSILNYLDVTVAVNAQKFFGFHAELGITVNLFMASRFSELRDDKWILSNEALHNNISASSIYTSIGYPIKTKKLSIAPIVRLDYYPLRRSLFAVGAGLCLTFKNELA